MRIKDSAPSKRMAGAPAEYGRYFRSFPMVEERENEKCINRRKDQSERKEKLLEFIGLFRETFLDSTEVMKIIEPLFDLWRKQNYNRFISGVMIEMQIYMSKNGLSEEWTKWEKVVNERLLSKKMQED